MILQIRFLFLIAWAMLSLSCASSNKNIHAVSPQTATVSQANIKPIKKAQPDPHLIIASDLSLQESAGFPTQINVIVNSYDCRTVTEVLREQHEGKFKIQLRSDKTSQEANCKRQEHIIPLPLTGLKAGIYTVKIHELEQSFELYSEQIEALPQILG